MASTEVGPKIVDLVTAELVECQPEAGDLSVDVSWNATKAIESIRQEIAEATIEQTGADPPPAGDR